MKQRDKLKRHFFLSAIIIAFLLMAIGQTPLYLLIPYVQARIPDPGINFLFMYTTYLGIWIVTLLYCRFAEKDTFNSFKSARRGGRKGNTFKHLAIGLLIGFILNGLCALAAFLHNDLAFSFSSFDILYLIVGLVVVFIQSGAEELLVRGYLYSVIDSRYGVVLAIIINSLFFAGVHGANDGITVLAVIHLTVVAVLLSLCIWRYDSLWLAMGIHTTWNYTQSLLLGLPNSGIVSEKALMRLDAASDSIFYSVSFGLEGGITVIVLQLAMIVYILLDAKRNKQAGSITNS